MDHKSLVIVESPAKGRTISAFLGRGFTVAASFGHVRDLPKKTLGVDVKHNFKPEYIIPFKARRTIQFLKKALAGKSKVYLATDLDREGEAISWHIIKALGLDEGERGKARLGSPQARQGKGESYKRIVFHEITKEAIEEALKHPRDIDMNLVDAQQARRVLDRLVGYKLSPLLWEKIYKGLSAGRVQSVALRLIVEREKEIESFRPEEYWEIFARLARGEPRRALLSKKQEKEEFLAKLIAKDKEKLEKLAIKNEKEATKVLADLKGANYKVSKIERKETIKWPFPPFTTSSLQQDAHYKLGFSAKQTMHLAQDLYEEGFITYMRTDSVNLSWLAINSARKLIEEKYGKQYLPEKPRGYKTKSRLAQEAHEAIRPTYIKKTPEKTEGKIDANEAKLYDLIWRRTVACQMAEARFSEAEAEIEANPPAGRAGNYTFLAKELKLKFKGFLEVYPIEIGEKHLPELKVGEKLALCELEKHREFTTPPPRYNEGSLVKTLEEYGIGRPSTYASIISTLFERGYIKKEKNYLMAEELGKTVTKLLLENFPEIMDYRFTAEVEEDLDKIAGAKEKWQEVVENFYVPFEKQLQEKEKTIDKKDYGKPQEIENLEKEYKDKTCPGCKKGKLVPRHSRFGWFIGCTNFPKCHHTEKINGKAS